MWAVANKEDGSRIAYERLASRLARLLTVLLLLRTPAGNAFNFEALELTLRSCQIPVRRLSSTALGMKLVVDPHMFAARREALHCR